MSTPYRLYWKDCAEDRELAERFYVPEFVGELPFFEGNPPVSSPTEEHLLKGLLTGLAEHDHAGRLHLRPKDLDTLLHLVEVLRLGFSFADTEEMVLETSGQLRAQYGSRPATAALSSGSLLVPESSKIKADLILDLWAVAYGLESADTGDHVAAKALRAQIPPLFDVLKAEEVPAGTLEACCYFTLCSRHLAGAFCEEGSLEGFMVDSVIGLIGDKQLKARVQAIVEAEKAGVRLDIETVHVV